MKMVIKVIGIIMLTTLATQARAETSCDTRVKAHIDKIASFAWSDGGLSLDVWNGASIDGGAGTSQLTVSVKKHTSHGARRATFAVSVDQDCRLESLRVVSREQWFAPVKVDTFCTRLLKFGFVRNNEEF